MRRVTHMNDSCCVYEQFYWRVWRSHVTHHTHEWVTSHIKACRTYTVWHTSRHTYEWVTSHIHMNESHHKSRHVTHILRGIHHVTHMNESRHTSWHVAHVHHVTHMNAPWRHLLIRRSVWRCIVLRNACSFNASTLLRNLFRVLLCVNLFLI